MGARHIAMPPFSEGSLGLLFTTFTTGSITSGSVFQLKLCKCPCTSINSSFTKVLMWQSQVHCGRQHSASHTAVILMRSPGGGKQENSILLLSPYSRCVYFCLKHTHSHTHILFACLNSQLFAINLLFTI